MIEVSVCCNAEVIDSFRDNPADHHDPVAICRCAKCKQECEVEFAKVVNDIDEIISKDELDLYNEQISYSL